MVTRIHLDEESDAQAMAEAIDQRGFEVAIIKERFAGEDDDELVQYVVCTTAAEDALADLVGEDVLVEGD